MGSSWIGPALAEFRLATSNETDQEHLSIYRIDDTTFDIHHSSGMRVDHWQFDITTNSLVPHWILADETLPGRNVNLVIGKLTVAYPLFYEDALKLQRIITGYTTVASSRNVTCRFTYHPHKSLKAFQRAKKYSGHGALQLWWPVPREGRSGFNSSTENSIAGSTTATGRTRLLGDVAAISELRNGDKVIIGAPPDPAVLVAIVQGEDDSYAILKFNIMALMVTRSAETIIDFSIGGEQRMVHMLKGPTAADWNLCQMIPIPEITRAKDSKLTKVQGMILSISFRDSEARESFTKSLEILQRKRAGIDQELRRLPNRVFTDPAYAEDTRSRPPRLPRFATFSDLELGSIAEMP